MNTIALSKCKKRLGSLWLILGIILFLLFFIQSLNGVYAAKEKEAWNWIIQYTFPIVSLIIGVFALDALNDNKSDKVVELIYYRIAFWISLFYLLIILLTLLYRPFTDYEPFEILQVSNFYLTPLQGLVTASLGIFFFKSSHTSK